MQGHEPGRKSGDNDNNAEDDGKADYCVFGTADGTAARYIDKCSRAQPGIYVSDFGPATYAACKRYLGL